MNVCFETFGCRLNRAEALEMESLYRANGWRVTSSHADADLIVVRGCSVTARAQHDCERLIAHIRRKYPMTRVRVTGCLEAEREHLPRLFLPEPNSCQTPPVPTRTARAYLKVQDGCNAACTFCIVPHFRGTSVSVPLDDVRERARRFVDAGYRELVVTGCNLTQYADGARRLPDVLEALAALDASVRIRLGSLEPGDIARETVNVMLAHANVCRFLHLSLQSGSDSILQAMKRPYRARDINALLSYVCDVLPLAGIGCDLMTGFPGERDGDFLRTQQLLERHAFSNAHVFPYSERPDTVAAKLPDAVARDVRSQRAHQLADLATEKRAAFARRFLGRTVEVVVEDAERIAGWTGEYLWCTANAAQARQRVKDSPVQRRDLVRMLVTDEHDGRLAGRLL